MEAFPFLAQGVAVWVFGWIREILPPKPYDFLPSCFLQLKLNTVCVFWG